MPYCLVLVLAPIAWIFKQLFAAQSPEQFHKLSSAIKTVYLDKKAQVELSTLITDMQKAISDFEKMEKNAPTILNRDPEVKKELDYFKTLFIKTIETLGARLAIVQGVKEHAEIKEMMLKEGLLKD